MITCVPHFHFMLNSRNYIDALLEDSISLHTWFHTLWVSDWVVRGSGTNFFMQILICVPVCIPIHITVWFVNTYWVILNILSCNVHIHFDSLSGHIFHICSYKSISFVHVSPYISLHGLFLSLLEDIWAVSNFHKYSDKVDSIWINLWDVFLEAEMLDQK